MSTLQAVAFAILFALATSIAFAVGACIFFSPSISRPPMDAGGFDLCIASLDPWGRPCCLDPGRGQCQ